MSFQVDSPGTVLISTMFPHESFSGEILEDW